MLAVIDTTTDTMTSSIPVATDTTGIAITRDGSTAYVTSQFDSTVSVVDLTLGTVVGSPIVVGPVPGPVALTPDGLTLYVANWGAASVSVIDTVTKTVTATVNLPNGFLNGVAIPSGIDVAPDGHAVYVLDSGYLNNRVFVIDPATNLVSVSPIAVGTSPASATGFMSPMYVSVGTPFAVGSDADLDAALFGPKFIPFLGGTLMLTANYTTSRTVSATLGGAFIDTNGFTGTLTGGMIGEGMLKKLGTGTLILSAGTTATNTGGTWLNDGTLEVDGTHTGDIRLFGGMLTGTGTIGSVAGWSNAPIQPGTPTTPGTLHVGNVTVPAGLGLKIRINSPTSYDVLNVTGTIPLDSVFFQPTLNYNAVPGDAFTVVTNTTGTFAGPQYAEGASFSAGNDVYLHITYKGGASGHDVVLAADGPPTSTTFQPQSAYAGATVGPLPFTIGDDFTDPSTMTIQISSSTPDIIPPGNVVIGGSGAHHTITVTLPPNVTGSGLVTLVISDGHRFVTPALSIDVSPAPLTYYLAEGATGPFFSTDLLIANPNNVLTPATVTFFKADGTTVDLPYLLSPTSRLTLPVAFVPGMESTAFSTKVVSPNGLPLAVERTMSWDSSGYGSHGEKASAGPASTWYFAEGSQGYFHTYFLLLNPGATANVAHITYLPEDGPPVQKDYPLAPTSRTTVDMASEPQLQNRSFGAQVTFDQPGMAERAMYFGDDPLYTGGTDSSGATAPSTSWFLAEGATGSYFDTFVLIANPNDVAANVTTTYLPASGAPVAKMHAVGPHQRLTINVATEDATLASAAVGTSVSSDQPVIVERSQYWPHGNWYEAHNSAGETSAGTKWALAEGRVGGQHHAQTYILLANSGTQPAEVTATFLRENGTTVVKAFSVAPTSRLNIAVTGPDSDVPELADENFGTSIVSTQPIIVERSMYTDANGVTWAAGTNATATRLP